MTLLRDMRPLGVFDTGEELRVQLVGNAEGGHLLVVGRPRSGKSFFMAMVGAQVVHCEDAVMPMIIDCGKACMDFDHVKGLAIDHEQQGFGFAAIGSAMVTDVVMAELMLTGVETLVAERVRRNLPWWPHVVVFIDEFRTLLDASPRCTRIITGIAQKALAVGVELVMGTQRATEGFIPNDLRALTATTLCFTTKLSQEGRYTFGENSKVDPSKLRMQSGDCFAATTNHPQEARATLHRATKARIGEAVRAARRQPTLDMLLDGWTGWDDSAPPPTTPRPPESPLPMIALGPVTEAPANDEPVAKILDALDDVGPARAGTLRKQSGLGGNVFDLGLRRAMRLGLVVEAASAAHGAKQTPIYARRSPAKGA